jgi:hypothetical protein
VTGKRGVRNGGIYANIGNCGFSADSRAFSSEGIGNPRGPIEMPAAGRWRGVGATETEIRPPDPRPADLLLYRTPREDFDTRLVAESNRAGAVAARNTPTYLLNIAFTSPMLRFSFGKGVGEKGS